MYSELLRLALAGDEPTESTLSDLVSQAVALRGMASAGASGAAGIGDALAYDVALIHLCERLGISHNMTGELAGPVARQRAERLVSELMPSLQGVLVGQAETGDDRGRG